MRVLRKSAAVFCFALLGVLVGGSDIVAAAGEAETIQLGIAGGEIRGVVADGVQRFLGLPYAQAPVGELRWRPPRPVLAWDGVRDAVSHGHACPQALGAYPEWADQAFLAAGLDEDCLTINVWAPADLESGPYPVMFYIHGGTMVAGSNVMPLYDGTELAKQGVVAVFVNYRLGYLGRFAHPAMSRLQQDEPLINYGTFDQIAALEWVQDNIAYFGGDPDNVTIYGHSAGGVSVNYLMITPQSKGLFHKAIAQGSGLLLDRDPHLTESLDRGVSGLSGEEVGELFAEHFEIPAGSDEEVVAALRAVQWPAIIEYQDKKIIPLNPFVDGKVVRDHIMQVFERGEQHDVPYIAGANSWEYSPLAKIPLIGKWFIGGELIAGLSDEDLAVFDDKWTRIGLSERWYAEGLFLLSTRYIVRQMANVSSPAWQYRGDYVPTAARGKVPGAPHGVEVAHLFGQIAEHPEYQRPPAAAEHPASAADIAWGDSVRAYWLNFAKTGNPNSPGLPEWPEYRPETDEALLMGEKFEPVNGLDKAVLDALEKRALIRRQRFDAMDKKE